MKWNQLGFAFFVLLFVLQYQNCQKVDTQNYQTSPRVLPDVRPAAGDLILDQWTSTSIEKVKIERIGGLVPPGTASHRIDLILNHQDQTIAIQRISWNPSIENFQEGFTCPEYLGSKDEYKVVISALLGLKFTSGSSPMGADGGFLQVLFKGDNFIKTEMVKSAFADQNGKKVIEDFSTIENFLAENQARWCGHQ